MHRRSQSVAEIFSTLSHARPYRLASALHVVPCHTVTRRDRFPLYWDRILLVAAISVSVTKGRKVKVMRSDSGCFFFFVVVVFFLS